jgi:hypothetical protein
LIGGGEGQGEEGPFGWLEGVGQVGHVGCCCQAISETADEEETVWFADGVGGVFECDEGFCLDCRFVSSSAVLCEGRDIRSDVEFLADRLWARTLSTFRMYVAQQLASNSDEAGLTEKSCLVVDGKVVFSNASVPCPSSNLINIRDRHCGSAFCLSLIYVAVSWDC